MQDNVLFALRRGYSIFERKEIDFNSNEYSFKNLYLFAIKVIDHNINEIKLFFMDLFDLILRNKFVIYQYLTLFFFVLFITDAFYH